LPSRGIKTLRFWNSHLRRNAQSIRDTIFNELRARTSSMAERCPIDKIRD
jgi:very-short-patch-repair endonuclease